MARYELVAKAQSSGDIYTVYLRDPYSREIKAKNELFEIDALTSQYPNIKSLEDALIQNNCIKERTEKIMIRYRHKQEDQFLDIVLNDPDVFHICMDLMKKKQAKYKVEVDLETKSGKKIFQEILSFLTKEETIDLLMQNDLNLVPFMIRNPWIKRYCALRKKTSLTLQEEVERRELEDYLKFILKRYKNLRGMCLWKNLYKNGKIRQKPRRIQTTFYDKVEYKEKPQNEEDFSEEMYFLSEEELNEMAGNDEEAVYRFRR